MNAPVSCELWGFLFSMLPCFQIGKVGFLLLFLLLSLILHNIGGDPSSCLFRACWNSVLAGASSIIMIKTAERICDDALQFGFCTTFREIYTTPNSWNGYLNRPHCAVLDLCWGTFKLFLKKGRKKVTTTEVSCSFVAPVILHAHGETFLKFIERLDLASCSLSTLRYGNRSHGKMVVSDLH